LLTGCGAPQIRLFRPDMNATRMARTAARLEMPPVPTDLFIKAVRATTARGGRTCRPAC